MDNNTRHKKNKQFDGKAEEREKQAVRQSGEPTEKRTPEMWETEKQTLEIPETEKHASEASELERQMSELPELEKQMPEIPGPEMSEPDEEMKSGIAGPEIQVPAQNKSRQMVIVLSVILVVLLIAAVVIGLNKSKAPEKDKIPAAQTESSEKEKWQEGVITHNGKAYKFNNNIKTYLVMGIDKDEPVTEAEDGVSGGQSDAMFLVAADSGNDSISVISINRNTMTKIEVCDKNGQNKQEAVAQLCLQHGYGDGKHYSCSRAVDAVSYLFYNLPISGYVSINMGAIPMLNDAVGGVEVTVLQDLTFPSLNVVLHEGEEKTLNGSEAYCYLRKRDIDEFNSAGDRLRRQEQYITSYVAKLKTALSGDEARALEIYDSVSEYLVTDVDFVALISELIDYEYDESRMYTVPGKAVMGEKYEEYYADDEALYELILQVFYKEVEQ